MLIILLLIAIICLYIYTAPKEVKLLLQDPPHRFSINPINIRPYGEKYCNKNGICIPLNISNLYDFNSIRLKLMAFYLELIDVLPPKDRRTISLRNNFNINSIFEVFPHNLEGDTSFTINKGEEMGICIRSGKDFYDIHNTNLLIFVFLHELAHIATVTHHHTNEFWSNFKYLLNICHVNNLFKVTDYAINPEEYCATSVSYSPYFDPNVV